jgi:hypothetical protein
MAVSAHPRPARREPAERRELDELARALDAQPVPLRRLPEPTLNGSQEPDTVEVSTFAALRTSGVVAGLVVLAMTLALLLAGQALHLGWPATPLHAGGDGSDRSRPMAYPLTAPSTGAPAPFASRPDQRRAGDHARSVRAARRARRGREGRARSGADAPFRSPRSGDRPGTVPRAPRPGAGPAPTPGGGGPGGGGTAPAAPGAPGSPVDVPGRAPLPAPQVPPRAPLP